MMIRLLKFIWYKVSAMGRFFRSISRAPGSDPTWRCRGTISAASPRNKQRFSTWKNGEIPWHHQHWSSGKTWKNTTKSTKRHAVTSCDFQVISPVSLVNSQFPCLHWSILIPSAVEMAGLFKHHATWRYCAHDRVLGIFGISRGPKAKCHCFSCFFPWAPESTPNVAGHTLDICTPSAHLVQQRVMRNWAKHPWKTMPSHAKSLQKTGSPSLAPSVLAPRLSNLQVLALLWLAQPPRL